MLAMLAICQEELEAVDMKLNIDKSSAIRVRGGWNRPIPPKYWQ